MLNLFLKDLRFQKNTFFIVIFYIAFGIIAIGDKEGFMLIQLILMVGAMLSISGPMAIDEKNNIDVIISSLPIKRSLIVISKYVNCLINIGIISIGIIIFRYAFKLLNITTIEEIFMFDLNTYVISVSIAIGVISLLTPLYLKYGVSKGVGAKGIMLLTIFIVVLFIGDSEAYTIIGEVMMYPIIVSMIALVMMTISLAISIKIYNNKEF